MFSSTLHLFWNCTLQFLNLSKNLWSTLYQYFCTYLNIFTDQIPEEALNSFNRGKSSTWRWDDREQISGDADAILSFGGESGGWKSPLFIGANRPHKYGSSSKCATLKIFLCSWVCYERWRCKKKMFWQSIAKYCYLFYSMSIVHVMWKIIVECRLGLYIHNGTIQTEYQSYTTLILFINPFTLRFERLVCQPDKRRRLHHR